MRCFCQNAVRKTGSKKNVTFDKEELKQFEGKIFTHNHPMEISFSPADLMRMYSYKLKEIRAATNNGIYMAKYTGKWKRGFLTDSNFKSFYLGIGRDIIHQYSKKIQNKSISIEDADTKVSHEIVKRLSIELGFEYKFITWEDLK